MFTNLSDANCEIGSFLIEIDTEATRRVVATRLVNGMDNEPVLIAKGYIYSFLVTWIVIGILICSMYASKPKSKFNYYVKFSLLYFSCIMITGLLVPVFMFQPKDPINLRIVAWFLRKFSYVLGITYEVRGADILKQDTAAMICVNHQSSLDLLSTLNTAKQMVKSTGIAKKEMFYVFPYGPAAWLAGLIFIDRKSKTAIETLRKCGEFLRKTKTKVIIYPEGTRNHNSGLLPFKKGAFVTAIRAQIPVIPKIIGPYYFVNKKLKSFDNGGHVLISVLPPISTVGLTMDDVDMLTNKVRDLMLAEYEKLQKEIEENSSKWRDIRRPRITYQDYKKND